MSLEANKAIVMRHFAVLNGGDPDDWDEIMAEDFEVHHPFASGTGRDRYRDSAAAYPTVFDGFVTEVHRLVAEDDVVVAYFTTRGRHTGELFGFEATGREFAFTGMAMYRIADRQLAEAWYAEDTLGWFQQLGLIPTEIGAFRRVWES
jgi:predicted ester cyclase